MALAFIPSYCDTATAYSWQSKVSPGYALVSTYAASDGKSQLLGQITELMMDCVNDDWDGHGASAPTREAYQAAVRFVEALPMGFQMPEVAVDPDGCFSFEWRRGKRRTVLVSVHTDYTLHFASLIGSSRQFGSDVFFKDLPVSIHKLVGQLYSV